MPEPNPALPDTGLVDLQDQTQTIELVSASILGLWDVVNNLTRLRPTRREQFRVTIFGSARVEQDHWVYGAVRDMSEELTRMGCAIITGGGPGLMQAANEGASLAAPDAKGRSVGIRIELPFEQDVNPFVGAAYEHRTFFSRLHHFMIVSDAFVVTPGGIGSLLELSLVWQLLQVRHLYNTPLILVGKMWADLVDWAHKAMLIEGSELASEVDFKIPHCVNTIDDALALIRENRAAWLAAQANESGTGRHGRT